MNILDVVFLGIVLAIDACALTLSNCTTYKETLTPKKEWSMPITFALFQGIMPLLGYIVGKIANIISGGVIEVIADWISFAIFLILSGKILFDLIKASKEQEEVEKKTAEFTILILIVQGIATSIDAFAVGITLINFSSILLAITVIAVETFILVTIFLFFGKKLGKIFGKYAEWIGAIILLILSIKALLQALNVI